MTFSKTHICQYHRLHGRLTDFAGQPFRGFVYIRPDGFEDSGIIAWANERGEDTWAWHLVAPLGGVNYQAVDLAPELNACDIRVEVDGQECRVISAQRYLETGPDGSGMWAYLVQFDRSGLRRRTGIQMVMVEYQKMVEHCGYRYAGNAMGHYRLALHR